MASKDCVSIARYTFANPRAADPGGVRSCVSRAGPHAGQDTLLKQGDVPSLA